MPACSSRPATRPRSAMPSPRWLTTAGDGASSARPAGVALRRATRGIASPRGTSVCWHVPLAAARCDVPAKVLYLHHVGELSGAEASLRLLLRHLDRVRVQPLFARPARGAFPAALAGGRALPAALAGAGVPALPWAFPPLRRVGGGLGAVRRLVRVVRQYGVDLLPANGPQTNVPAAIAGRLTGVPVIWHTRNLIAGD